MWVSNSHVSPRNSKNIGLAKTSREHPVQPADFQGGPDINHLREIKTQVTCQCWPWAAASHLLCCDKNTHHHWLQVWKCFGCSKEIKGNKKNRKLKKVGYLWMLRIWFPHIPPQTIAIYHLIFSIECIDSIDIQSSNVDGAPSNCMALCRTQDSHWHLRQGPKKVN